MKALLISDVECPALWDYFRPERLNGADLIISCGDLKREYLEFLVTLSGKPVFYVPGNHDSGYEKNPPEGCECLDDRVVTYRGVRFLGFGGCKRYNQETYQYTEKEMIRRKKWTREPKAPAGWYVVKGSVWNAFTPGGWPVQRYMMRKIEEDKSAARSRDTRPRGTSGGLRS